jgi:ribosomal protein L44E
LFKVLKLVYFIEIRKYSCLGKRRYDKKQQGFGGQTKPVFHKKVCTLTDLQSQKLNFI